MGKKKVGDAADYIIPIGLVGLAAFAIYKLFNGGLFGPSGTSNNNQQATSTTAATAAAAFQASAAQVPQSLSDSQLNTIVNTLMADYHANTNIASGTQYTDDIVNQMSQLDNITDLYRLIQLFGTQQISESYMSACALFDVACNAVDLGTFLHAVLSPAQLATVNQDLQGNGIDYTFN